LQHPGPGVLQQAGHYQASPARPPPPRRPASVQLPSGDTAGADTGPLSQPLSAPLSRRSSSHASRPRSAGAEGGRQRGGSSSGGGGGGAGAERVYVDVACDQLRGRLDLNKMTITVQSGEVRGRGSGGMPTGTPHPCSMCLNPSALRTAQPLWSPALLHPQNVIHA
jgi:hypothetical protein